MKTLLLIGDMINIKKRFERLPYDHVIGGLF